MKPRDLVRFAFEAVHAYVETRCIACALRAGLPLLPHTPEAREGEPYETFANVSERAHQPK